MRGLRCVDGDIESQYSEGDGVEILFWFLSRRRQ